MYSYYDPGTPHAANRWQNDYIELSRQYHSVLISNVPVMGAAIEDQARRFINLVDEFYDPFTKLFRIFKPKRPSETTS